MTSKLDALRQMSTVVADTGDMESIKCVQADRFDDQSDADPEGRATAGLSPSCRRGGRLGREDAARPPTPSPTGSPSISARS